MGECKGYILVDVFVALRAAIKASNVVQFKEPNRYVGENRKGAVISLTSQRSVVMLFAILAGFGDVRVWKYFSCSLKGSRKGKPKLIVNRDKNCFITNTSRGSYCSGRMSLWSVECQWIPAAYLNSYND